MPIRSLCAPALLAVALLAGRDAHAGAVYLALGDSVTFGYDPSTPSASQPSFANQGFVPRFADSLAGLNGGVRPTVLNLGIVGELSTSFFNGTPPPGYVTYPQLNLNYPDPSVPQNDRMLASIQSIHAAGNSVGFVSLLFGSNDIFYLIGTPAFQDATPADQQAMVAATIGTVQMNYLRVLTELKTLAPEARLILPDYYNPFPSFAPEHAFYDAVLGIFNPLVKSDAAAFGATFVDLYPAFVGRELGLTNIATGDFHPNQAGYAVIAGVMANAVPEPASMVMLGMGLIGLAGYGWRRGKAA